MIHGKRSSLPAPDATVFKLVAQVSPFFRGMISRQSRLRHPASAGLLGRSGSAMRLFGGIAFILTNLFSIGCAPLNRGFTPTFCAGSAINRSGEWGKLIERLGLLTGRTPLMPRWDFSNCESLPSGAEISAKSGLALGAKKVTSAMFACLLNVAFMDSLGGHLVCG